MKRYVSLLFALLAVAAVSAVAVASASAAEPTVLFLSPETFPVELTGSNATTATELQNAAGTLKGEGYTLAMTEKAASEKAYSVTFSGVNKNGEKCNSPGAGTGSVVISANPYKLVFDALGAEAPALGVAALFTVNELTVECGTTKIKIKGNALGLVTPIKTEGTAFKGILHCSATVGEPAETKFWNSAGTEETAKLEANFGSGFKKACELITGEVPLTASKMIEIMG
jgi:hypothetical protein